jgi:hypothetical protein
MKSKKKRKSKKKQRKKRKKMGRRRRGRRNYDDDDDDDKISAECNISGALAFSLSLDFTLKTLKTFSTKAPKIRVFLLFFCTFYKT